MNLINVMVGNSSSLSLKSCLKRKKEIEKLDEFEKELIDWLRKVERVPWRPRVDWRWRRRWKQRWRRIKRVQRWIIARRNVVATTFHSRFKNWTKENEWFRLYIFFCGVKMTVRRQTMCNSTLQVFFYFIPIFYERRT